MIPITFPKVFRALGAMLFAMMGIPGLTAITALCAFGALTGCANKTVLKPKDGFLQNGAYRSRIETVPGTMTGLSLRLNGNGRFSFATRESGCILAEDWGVWTSTQEELTLRVEKSMRRPACDSAWRTTVKNTAYHCSMRNVTDRSFQLLHDEIQQGTTWTAWEHEAAQGQGPVEAERLRTQPNGKAVSWNTSAGD